MNVSISNIHELVEILFLLLFLMIYGTRGFLEFLRMQSVCRAILSTVFYKEKI